MKTTIQEIAKAIYIVNTHAKNAPELYTIKNRAIQRLLKEGRAEKLGLNYSQNPRNALQHLDVLVTVDKFLFHHPSTKEDRNKLKIIVSETNHRNSKVSMPLRRAKQILEAYSPLPKPPGIHKRSNPKQYTPYIGLSTYLNGKSK